MQRSLKLASQLGRIITVEPLLTHWRFAVQAAHCIKINTIQFGHRAQPAEMTGMEYSILRIPFL
jgi:hypothetical protein